MITGIICLTYIKTKNEWLILAIGVIGFTEAMMIIGGLTT